MVMGSLIECLDRGAFPSANRLTAAALARGIVIVLFFCLLPAIVRAAPEVPGEEDGTGAEETPEVEAMAVPDPALLSRMQERARELQSRDGPYAPALVETLGDLGRLHQALENHDQAVETLSRALHVARVTDGLYSERQLRVLGELIESERARKNWQQVDDYHHLALQIQNRLYEPGSTDHVAAIREFGDWKMQAYRGDLLEHSGTRGRLDELYTLHELYQNALTAMEDDRSDDAGEFALLYGRARVEYEIARSVHSLPVRSFHTSAQRYNTRTVCGSMADENGDVQRVCWSERVENPGFEDSRRDERRLQVRRASTRVKHSIEAMESLLADSEALAPARKAARAERLAELEKQLERLEREARHARRRSW